ncbi:hypothetical protein AB835_11715 [Candidatus Endobugula sertula]|uniref:Uncharacterized protein n=1 Tax=Candidatus Endobugula sertula TaxID=62101 RepID=A0A1D2QMW1_9GAMM|nr:hypothetical protein AB835_11715 [Candidatus Endobugula sertula]
MPVEIVIYLDKCEVQQVINVLQTLPACLQPKYFSEEETVKSKKDQVGDEKRFNKFISHNPIGFFLFGESCMYDIALQSKGYTKIYCDINDESLYSHIPLFFRVMATIYPIFGFAGENQERLPDADGSYVITHEEVTSERDHRNKHFITIGINHIESGIGNDLNKYIPGVYWYTLLSDELLKKHNVNLSNLSGESISCELLGDDSLYLLKFYENPEDWRVHADRLDDLCEKVDGMFSRRDVEKALVGVDSYLDYDDIISEWR